MSRGKKLKRKVNIACVDNGDGGFNAWCFTESTVEAAASDDDSISNGKVLLLQLAIWVKYQD